MIDKEYLYKSLDELVELYNRNHEAKKNIREAQTDYNDSIAAIEKLTDELDSYLRNNPLECPVCNNPLKLRYKRQETGESGFVIYCPSCMLSSPMKECALDILTYWDHFSNWYNENKYDEDI